MHSVGLAVAVHIRSNPRIIRQMIIRIVAMLLLGTALLLFCAPDLRLPLYAAGQIQKVYSKNVEHSTRTRKPIGACATNDKQTNVVVVVGGVTTEQL